MIRGLVFDLDGVLVDTSRVWHRVQNDVAEALGHPPVPWEAFRSTFGQGTSADVAQFYPGSPVAEVDRLYHRHFLARLGEVEVVPGAPELLGRLRERGVRRAVATNTARELAIALCRTGGFLELLDAVASAEEVPQAKPAPDVLLLAIERLGLAKDEVLYVGDAVYDAMAAQEAGVRFVGFRREGDERVEEPAEIEKLLGYAGR